MKFFDYINSINKYFAEQGIVIDPLPKVELNDSIQDRFDPFIKTADYNHSTHTIRLFVDKRHLKDILRSYCHELIHAS